MDELDSLLEEAKTWPTKGVIIDGFILHDGRGREEKKTMDLCEHIGCDSNDDLTKKLHLNEFKSLLQQGKLQKIYLSSEFNEQRAKGRKNVIKYITNRFDSHGGGGVVAGGGGDGKIQFKCSRHRKYKPNKDPEKNKTRGTTTAKPQSIDDTCPWKFTLYYEPPDSVNSGRYYFYRNGSGNRFHTGHFPKQEHEIIKRQSQLDEKELEIADDGMGVNLSSNSMAMMFQTRTGLAIDPKKLRNYHVRKNQTNVDGSCRLTQAENVIHVLTSNKNVSVAYLVARVEVGIDLVTTYAKKTKRNLTVTFQSNVTSNGFCHDPKSLSALDVMSTSFAVSMADGDTPEKTALDIYDSLKISHGTEILLSIAFCTDKQRRLLALFPESATCDVLFKMNNEKRPTFHICSKTSSNQTFGGLYIFLASQATWSFDYAWSTLVPSLVDPRFISRNKLMTTDNDNKLYGPFESQRLLHVRFLNALHRLCMFHGITQVWTTKGHNISASRVQKGYEEIGLPVLEAIKSIVLSWTDSVESADELQVSYDCLKALLSNSELMKCFDPSFADEALTLVQNRIWIYRNKLAHYRYMGTRTFRTRTSNSSEVEGGILKHHAAGPKPNHSMAKAADSTCKVSDLRINMKEQKAAKAVDSVPTKLDKPELAPLYDTVSEYCADNVADNYERRESKAVFRATPSVFWVKQKSFRMYSSDPKNAKEYSKYLSVRFERTRIVEIIQVGSVLYLKCSCCGYEQDGYMCSCIAAVLDQAPNPRDVVIRWHKPYIVLYLTGNKQIDEAFDRRYEMEQPGPIVSASSAGAFRPDLVVGECTTNHEKEYFERTLPSKPPKLHPGVIWAREGPHASNPNSSTSNVENGALVGRTVVALSQSATESNATYLENTHGNDDADFPVGMDEESEANEMDQSMDTYATKSPDRTSLSQSYSPIGKVKRRSAMQATKAIYESTCNTCGTDPELTDMLIQALRTVHVAAMAKQRSKSTNESASGGMQSLPKTDTARKSVRIESAPTGNTAAAKARKRVAKKPPPKVRSESV